MSGAFAGGPVGLLEAAVRGVRAFEADFEIDRSVAGKIPAIIPVARLDDMPCALFTAGIVDLRETMRVEFVIAHDHMSLRIEAEHDVVVDDSALGRDVLDDVRGFWSDWQREGFTRSEE